MGWEGPAWALGWTGPRLCRGPFRCAGLEYGINTFARIVIQMLTWNWCRPGSRCCGHHLCSYAIEAGAPADQFVFTHRTASHMHTA